MDNIDQIATIMEADKEKLDVLLKEMSPVRDVKCKKDRKKRVHLHPLSCFMGAYFLKSYSEINVSLLKEWKERPLEYPYFTNKMVSDFILMWEKRKTFVDFLTVPPPSGKREKGYEDYPIEIVAKLVSESIDIPYIRVFLPRCLKTERGCRARMHQKQEEFLFDMVPRGNVGLIIDDVSTTRTTFSLVHRVFMKHQKVPFCIAWVSFEHGK